MRLKIPLLFISKCNLVLLGVKLTQYHICIYYRFFPLFDFFFLVNNTINMRYFLAVVLKIIIQKCVKVLLTSCTVFTDL